MSRGSAVVATSSFYDREEVKRQADRVLAVLSAVDPRPDESISALDAPLIGIVGERGSGKTTLLRGVCEALRGNDSFLVLGEIRPEIVVTSESLVVAFVTEATNLVNGWIHSDGLSRELETLKESCQVALRSALFVSAGSVKELFDSSESISQFSLNSASVVSRAARADDDLRAMVRLLIEYTGVTKVVVPVDDIDLFPGRLSRLLSDARALASCPGLEVICCLSRSDLRANLHAELSLTFPSLAAIDRERLVHQQVMKALRPDRVFEPLQLPRNARADFVPIGASESLGSLITETLSLLSNPSGSTGLTSALDLGEWFNRSVRGHYHSSRGVATAWLPSTYRALTNMYYEFSELRSALKSSEAGLEAAHHLRTLLYDIAREVQGLHFNIEFDAIESSSQSRFLVEADWPTYRANVEAERRWITVSQLGRTKVRLREARSIHVTYLPPELEGKSEPPTVLLGSAEASSVLIIQSILDSNAMQAPRPTGGAYLGETACEHLQSVSILGLETNDRILLLPVSRGVMQSERWRAAWNWFVRAIDSEGAVFESDRAAENLDRAVGLLCHSVVEIWWHGRSPEPLATDWQPIDFVLSAASLYLHLSLESDDADLGESSSASAYTDWFELYLPLSFHEGLLSSDMLTACLETWQAALASTSTGGTALTMVRGLFERRLEFGNRQSASLRKESLWNFGYRSLVRSLSADLSRQMSEFEKEYRERETRGNRGQSAVESTVTLSERSEEYRFAPRLTREGKDQERSLMKLLDQLRQV